MESGDENVVQPGNKTASLDQVVKLQKRRKTRQVKEKRNPLQDDCLMFTVADQAVAAEALELLKRNAIAITYKDTRSSNQSDEVDVYVEFIPSQSIDDVIFLLKEHSGVCHVTHKPIPVFEDSKHETVPWFPRCVEDLDHSNENVIMCGSELKADHPGFKDDIYRERRAHFTEVAINYKCGDPIPRIEYTKEETETWSKVYKELTSLYPTHACKKQIENMQVLANNCQFNGDQVPQLEDVSKFLQCRTGFTLRPAAGFLIPRDFLAGLAFRVFNCTQYMRHSSDPFYTPEPDVCHELLGHVPLLADPGFAQFSQELGLASLGVSDEDIKRLASCYLYTVEFGLCKEDGKQKAYGAGLLSCIAELKHALTSPEKILPFEPEVAANTESYVTCFQPTYFVSESLEEVKAKMRDFVKTIKRPFRLEYAEETRSIRIKSKKSKIYSIEQTLKQIVPGQENSATKIVE